jgi:hypothetical protein
MMTGAHKMYVNHIGGVGGGLAAAFCMSSSVNVDMSIWTPTPNLLEFCGVCARLVRHEKLQGRETTDIPVINLATDEDGKVARQPLL